MALTWARRRQFNYIVGVVCVFLVAGILIYFFSKPEPTCFDGKWNGEEAGVDCGGPCTLACTSQVKNLKIYWTRPIQVETGRYDLVAQVENLNADLGVRNLGYTFSLYDENNILLTKREGTTFVNPGEKFVIFESRLETGERVAKKAFLEFADKIIWEKAEPIGKDLYIERRDFVNEPQPILHLLIGNKRLELVRNVRIISVLSDINGNALASSATLVDEIGPNSAQDVYLTWPKPLELAPTFIDSYWRLSTFVNR